MPAEDQTQPQPSSSDGKPPAIEAQHTLGRAPQLIDGAIAAAQTKVASARFSELAAENILQLLKTYDTYCYIGEGGVPRDWAWGLGKALVVYWAEPQHDRTPFFKSPDKLLEWAAAVLATSGRIAQAEFIAYLLREGQFKVASAGPGEVALKIVAEEHGFEQVEARDTAERLPSDADMAAAKADIERLNEETPRIDKIMNRLVRRWHKHFIAYDADPAVDEYYRTLARAVAPSLLDYDAFPAHAVFDGIRFDEYRTALTEIVGFMFKHRRFCDLLCMKERSVRLCDILTFPCDRDNAVEYIGLATGYAEDKCSKILRAVTLDSSCLAMMAEPLAPAPPQIALGRKSVVRSYAGCTWRLFHFLNRKLRFAFPADYDSNVDGREEMFRRELAVEFAERFGCWFSPRTPRIFSPAGSTDIDAICVHGATGTVGLFQLKWQDPFGGSGRERRSRMVNFTKSANEWVAKTRSWLGTSEAGGLLRSIGVPVGPSAKPVPIRLFVIGRHFSRFTGQQTRDSSAAWGNWNQVRRIISGSLDGADPVGSLYNLLIAEAAAAPDVRHAIESLKLGDFTLTMVGPGQDSG